MAEGVRPRQQAVAAPPPRRRFARYRPALLPALFLALPCAVATCTRDAERGPASERRTPAPRRVDLAAIPEAEIPAAVLEECHALLRGRMHGVAATVTLAGGRTVQVAADLPERIRYGTRQGIVVLDGDAAFRILPRAAGSDVNGAADERQSSAPLEGDELVFARAVRTLLDAATLGPLYRATGCRRLGDAAGADAGAGATFELAQPSGAPWILTLQPDTLLPSALAGPDGEVRVLDHLRTSLTWIARRLAIGPLGECEVAFELEGREWLPGFFATPEERAAIAPANGTAPPPRRVPASNAGVEPRSHVPAPGVNRAQQWVVLDDPGAWDARHVAVKERFDELERQNQQSAGFPIFFAEGGRARLAVPFRRRAGGPAFAAPSGWELRELPQTDVVYVYPPEGDFDARRARGEELLRAALQRDGKTATGPITAQPYLHLQEGVPPAAKLAAPEVRVAVAVR